MPELVLTIADAATLRALFDEQLSKRRAFLPGAGGVEPQMACDLVLRHGERSHRVAAEVVYVKAEDPGRGVGLQLGALDATAMSELRAFVESAVDAAPIEGKSAEGTEKEAVSKEERDEAVRAPLFHERMRTLTNVEQLKLAANGTLPERIAIERMYGPTVWETLLRNPRLTIPEVARIARKGTLPRPLVDTIAANGTWLAAGEVQRALLSNPRSTTATIARVLNAMPRGDLARATQQTAYPMAVRNAAKKMLGG